MISTSALYMHRVFEYSRNAVKDFVRPLFLLCQFVRSSVRIYVMTKLALNVKATSYQRNIVSRSMQHITVDTTFHVVCRLGNAERDFKLSKIGFLAKLVMSGHQQIYPRTKAHIQGFCKC